MQTLIQILAREDERRNLRVGAFIILATVALVTIAVALSEDFAGLGQAPPGERQTTVTTDTVE